MVLEQEKIRHPQDQKELRVAPWAHPLPPELRREQTEQHRTAQNSRCVQISSSSSCGELHFSAVGERESLLGIFSPLLQCRVAGLVVFFVALVRVEVCGGTEDFVINAVKEACLSVTGRCLQEQLRGVQVGK